MSAVASAVTGRSSWGVIGRNVPGPLKSRPELQGVVRSAIDGGLEYLLDPPPSNGLRSPFPCWAVVDETTCELNLDRLRDRRFASLRQLRVRLEMPKEDGTAWDALLDEADGVIRETLECAGKLHAIGVGLALLQPDNLLYQDDRTKGDIRVLLPDVGFVRVRTTLVPDWMRPDCEFARLWDESPEKMLTRSFVLAKYPEFADRVVGGLDRDRPVGLSFKGDVRTLARLIAWLLTGSVVTTIPDLSTSSSIVLPFSRAAVWSVLRDALEGRIDSPSKLEQAPVGSSVTSNGYIGYYGLWMPITVPSGSTVNKINYSNSAATKVPYTLYSTGGKLYKYTTVPKKLSQLNKVTFWYYAQNTIAVSNIGTTISSINSMAGGTQNSQYELYWDETAKYFVVSGQINATSHNMEPLAVPGYVTNANMAAGNLYGLFAWSQMLGGQFSINGTEFAKIGNLVTNPSTGINVVTQTQDLVYPSNYAAVGNLTCINDCPTSTTISASNTAATQPTPTYVTPYVNPGWTSVTAASLLTYPLDTASGNLLDPGSTTVFVLNTATTGMNANGIRSGRMVDAAGLAAINFAKCGSNISCPTSSYNQGDVDLAGGTYFVWETGVQPWNQTSYLMSQATTPVLEVFDAPLQVSFVVPTGAKYGSYQGATISLQYGGFGDLWGIPNKCIDVSTNAACNFAQAPLYQALNFRWTPDFSIPCTTTAGGACDGTAGLVTVATTQGTGASTVNAGTTYYAKALDKEVRLRNATLDPTNPCTAAGLTAPAVSTLSLATSFADPSTNVGAKPVVTAAPRVIHGVKQY